MEQSFDFPLPWSPGPLGRFNRLKQLMDRDNLDLTVVSDPNNVYYFTGLHVAEPILSSVFSQTLPTYLFVFRDRQPMLLTGERNRARAAQNFGGETVSYVHYAMNQRMIAYPDFVAEQAKKILQVAPGNIRAVGVENWHVPKVLVECLSNVAPKAVFRDLSGEVMSMRMRKDPDEVEAFREACELNDFAYAVARDASKPGTSELEVYSRMQAELTKKVGFYQLFAADVISGERTLDIGGPPTRRVLNAGETFVLDLWLTARGYWSDACRTFVIGGSPTQAQTRILELLKEAMKAGEEKLRPGVKGRDVHKAVYDVIAKAGYGSHFPHHAGHALGLDDQEPPFFIPACEDEIVENTACTLEPGVYLPEIGGIRIENNYLVKSSGAETLTKFPLDM